MIRKALKILLLCFFFTNPVCAHSGKPKYHVAIDTDGAIDDMRSLSMFLSGNDIRVLAITCSQGTLLPDSVYVKVESLLSVFHHEGIRVGIGNNTGQELPVWSSFAQNISWGKLSDLNKSNVKSSANETLNKITENYPEKITLIALGSLNTFADWIKTNSKANEKIERIIWYNNPEIENGFNYNESPESYNYIRENGIELVIVGNISDNLFIDEIYLNSIRNSNSTYAKQIRIVHEQPVVLERVKQKHLQFWDDIIPLYLTVPVIFESEVKDNIRLVRLNQNIPNSFIYELVGELLESATITNNRVFNTFPADTLLYKPDYAKILNSTIEKFGVIEWKAICMTNEIHGHTGIYSIIGAKMGIRAMEYFNVGVNNLSVTAYTGHKPPLSCFNDGIQISTGATIGQGLITVSDSVIKIPTATFEFNNLKVKISLKKEITMQMQHDIKYAVQMYGLLTEKYWLYIEKLAINYWSEYNRFEIFNFEKEFLPDSK